jgi:hypothetical protein
VSDYPARPYVRTRARLQALLDELLDDGTSQIRPELQALADNLLAMPKPDRALNWLHNNPHAGRYLQGLARGEIPLTHDGLHELTSWRTAAHLRDLLMDAGALPTVDRQITLFESWTRKRLTATVDHDHALVLRQFLTWHQLPRMHATARRRSLTPGARNYAAEAFGQAEQLLNWLSEQGVTLVDLTQTDLDRWHAERPDRAAEIFLGWAHRNGHSPRLHMPTTKVRAHRPPISQQKRLDLTGRAFTDESIALRTRVAACLLLLFAQPVTRIVKLTIDDILRDGPDVYLRLGNPPTPIPAPLSEMILELLQTRANMNTATNPDSRWLFPGGRVGQPLTPGALRQHFQALGLPTTPARTAALGQLVMQVPAPVVAAALGYNDNTTENHRVAAAGNWSRYSALPR